MQGESPFSHPQWQQTISFHQLRDAFKAYGQIPSVKIDSRFKGFITKNSNQSFWPQFQLQARKDFFKSLSTWLLERFPSPSHPDYLQSPYYATEYYHKLIVHLLEPFNELLEGTSLSFAPTGYEDSSVHQIPLHPLLSHFHDTMLSGHYTALRSFHPAFTFLRHNRVLFPESDVLDSLSPALVPWTLKDPIVQSWTTPPTVIDYATLPAPKYPAPTYSGSWIVPITTSSYEKEYSKYIRSFLIDPAIQRSKLFTLLPAPSVHFGSFFTIFGLSSGTPEFP
jgi:hypothetical protein